MSLPPLSLLPAPLLPPLSPFLAIPGRLCPAPSASCQEEVPRASVHNPFCAARWASPSPRAAPGILASLPLPPTPSSEALGCSCLWEKSWRPALGPPKGGTSSLSREGGASEGCSLPGEGEGGLTRCDGQRPLLTRSDQLASGNSMSRTDLPLRRPGRGGGLSSGHPSVFTVRGTSRPSPLQAGKGSENYSEDPDFRPRVETGRWDCTGPHPLLRAL